MTSRITDHNSSIEDIEALRRQFVYDFPRERLMNLTMEEYTIGRGDRASFCYRLEHEQVGMGDIRGTFAGSKRYGVWFDKESGDYTFSKVYGKSVKMAFFQVKRQIKVLLDAGEHEDYTAIRNNKVAPLVKYKLLAMYFPDRYLTIYSPNHLSHFCNSVGIPAVDGDDEIVMQRKLLQWKESHTDVLDFSLLEYVKYLYDEFGKPPKQNNPMKKSHRLRVLRKELNDYDESHPKIRITEVEVRERKAIVAAIAKERAHGICQLCGKPAPFYNRLGEPYLECHHIIWLADGGADEPENAVALCPNCHRKMHSLNEPADVERLKEVAKK